MKRVGIFGGTFNPPHEAHHRLAMEAVRSCALDEVIVVPTFLPPHKQTKTLLPGEARLELCKFTFTEPIFSFSDFELNKGGKSYTVETLRHFKAERPDELLFLILGSDMLLSFDRWYCWQEILSLCSLIVLTREHDITNEKLASYAREVLHLRNNAYHILQSPAQELSSTEIRALLRQGADVSRFLAQRAYQRILEKGYYHESD